MTKPLLRRLGLDGRLQPRDHVARLVAALEDAGQAQDAHRRRQRLAEELARGDAVELAAAHALAHLQLVAGDGVEVQLDAQRALGLGLDLAGERA